MTTALTIKPPGTLRPGQAYPVLRDDGTMCVVRQTDDGLLQSTNLWVPLRKELGHYHEIEGKRSISAVGYEYINRFLGVNVYVPDYILDAEGKRVCNPVEFRDDRGDLKRLTIRGYGIGRNAVGNLTVYSETLIWDMEVMLAQDAFAKWETKEWTAGKTASGKSRPPVISHRDWGTLYNADGVPDEVRADPTTRCLPIPATGTVLAAKLTGEMITVVRDHLHRSRFASRIASTILKRRILKHFVGATVLDERGTVAICSWQQPDRANLADIANMVKQAESGGLETVEHSSEVDADEMAYAGVVDVEPREPFEPEAVQVAPEPEPVAVPKPTAKPRPKQKPKPDPADVDRKALLLKQIQSRAMDLTDGQIAGLLEQHPSIVNFGALNLVGELSLDAFWRDMQTALNKKADSVAT